MNRAENEGNGHDGSLTMGEDAQRVMMSVATFHARQVARKLGLDADERADVEQDILLALLERRRAFDASRGSWATFVFAVVGNVVADTMDALRKAKERQGMHVPLDFTEHSGIDEDAVANPVLVDERPSPEADLLMALSLERFIATLPPVHAAVARLMLEEDGNVAAAQERSGLSPSEFFRRLRELRWRLRCVDLARLPRPRKVASPKQQHAA